LLPLLMVVADQLAESGATAREKERRRFGLLPANKRVR
jgi:hypothetical protein